MSLSVAELGPDASTRGRRRVVDERQTELRRRLDNDLLRVERDADDVDAWTRIAFAETLLGVYDDAVDAFRRATELEPTASEQFWYAMGVAATRSGRWEEALRAFEELTRINPRQPMEWILKSMALENLGRPAESEAALR